MAERGLVFIISAPAGAGKTTLVNRLTQEYAHIKQSVSFTTRSPRPQEIDGVHYNFISKESFDQMIASKDFLEYVNLYGDQYGTSLKAMESEQQKGHHIVLVIDVQGALQLRKTLDAVFIFIKPPSIEALRDRMLLRQTEDIATIKERLKWAVHEMAAASEYDYEIINDDLEAAYEALKSIVIAEEHRIRPKTH